MRLLRVCLKFTCCIISYITCPLLGLNPFEFTFLSCSKKKFKLKAIGCRLTCNILYHHPSTIHLTAQNFHFMIQTFTIKLMRSKLRFTKMPKGNFTNDGLCVFYLQMSVCVFVKIQNPICQSFIY